MARKNFLFADTELGAQASAIVFSIIETAKMNNLDVFGYLNHLLTEIPKFSDNPTKEQIESVLSWSDTIPDYCKNQSKNNLKLKTLHVLRIYVKGFSIS